MAHYSVLVYELASESVRAAEPTPLCDVVVSVTTDFPAKVEPLGRAAAELLWPSVHSGDTPANLGTVVVEMTG